MPSIPQSLLWISLVVLWLFVLVPMLISKRDAVRRTSDVALATRVLNGGAGSRLLKRTGPAAGHRTDPDWQPEEEWDTDRIDGAYADADQDHDVDTDVVVGQRSAVATLTKADKAAADGGDDYLDVDIVDEDAPALPVGAGAAAADGAALLVVKDEVAEDEAEPVDETGTETETDADLAEDEYEYVDDSSGLEPEEDDEEDAPLTYASGASRRRRYDNKTAAAVSARKYAFRKRVLVVMALVLVGSAIAAFEVTSLAWWVCGIATTITLFYLAYLRRQTKIEEQVRRRRMRRMARARMGVENTEDRDYDVVPSRLRRPGAVVLEIDDEDPIFEHLDYAVAARNYGWPRDLPRAVGQ
ncbi:MULTISPECIES: divisome protein SepX/GlpR [Mycobacterium]|uniref:Membrane protein n=1 Tax=Mycobacterium kiyosense TaxID=2871094 RepID=A0A9P3V0P7_9MYCO|nr:MULTISPECIES: gephyrin-like molybdotransferase receptor GlpR [Mycobacterium]BDB44760.1 membrane protein [Mycobacterium kiyosense]BDE16255.1 membrane protein [Mycobacterium sp. 20KCMC460]GLB83596.1 membrane protein [Mycobacterium kiyosense]GLB89750.1 membrane protein [Mycobacterium kiyosense]GLB97616.1 membrane protein [Mycobacterium kiyosense]